MLLVINIIENEFIFCDTGRTGKYRKLKCIRDHLNQREKSKFKNLKQLKYLMCAIKI